MARGDLGLGLPAFCRARSNVRVMKARVWISYSSTRRISVSTSSTGKSFRAAIKSVT